MTHYSDPTANRALGPINREFSKLEKKAKNLCRLLDEGKITPEEFENAHCWITPERNGKRKNSRRKSCQSNPRRFFGGGKLWNYSSSSLMAFRYFSRRAKAFSSTVSNLVMSELWRKSASFTALATGLSLMART